MHLTRKLLLVYTSVFFFFLFFLLFKTETVYAAGNTCTWTDLGGDNKFSTASNWSGCAGGVPQNGDNLVFTEASASDNTNEYLQNDLSGLVVNNITFTGLVTVWLGTHIEGNEITITSGIDVTQYKSSDLSMNVVILAPVKLGGNVMVTGSNPHIFNLSDLNLNGHTLTNNDTGDSFGIGGVISGNGNIIANQNIYIDPGFSNNGPDNTWTGNLYIGSGVFADVDPGALGSLNSTITIDEGGTLKLAAYNGATIPQAITMGGSGSTITDLDGNDVLSGAILTDPYYSDPADVILSGAITLTSNTAIRSRGTTKITGPISGNYTISFLESAIGPGPLLPYCSELNEPCALLICSSDNQSLTPNSTNCSGPIISPIPTSTSTPTPTPKPTATPTPTVTKAPLPPANPGNSPINLIDLIKFLLTLRPTKPSIPTPPPAPAVPPLNDNYPDANVPCAHAPFSTNGVGYWCKNYDWGYTREDKNGYVPQSTTWSSRGYSFRNCTDYVAWKVKQVHNITLPRGWNDAKKWATNAKAAGYKVDTTPKVGDIAVWTNEPYGHVAYVAGFNRLGVPIFYEYNKKKDGNFTYTREGKADFYIHFTQ